MELLRIEHLEKYYGRDSSLTQAVNDLSFTVNEGEFLTIMGPSGSGKTTVLNCIATIDRPTAGHIYLEGEDITSLKGKKLSEFRKNKLGIIFQNYNLLETLTCFQNIALPLTMSKKETSFINTEVKEYAKQFSLSPVLEKYPHEISGGQKQLVAAARAVIKNPRLILADEPTGALDSGSAMTLLDSFVSLNEEHKATILMVTHDSNAASFSRRVLFIRDGKLFHEISRGSDSRRDFFEKIINTVSLLGGMTDISHQETAP